MLNVEVVKYHFCKYVFTKIHRKYYLLGMELLNHLCEQYTIVDICSVVWRRWEGKNCKGNMLVCSYLDIFR